MCTYIYMHIFMWACTYTHLYIYLYSPNYDASQGRGSYFASIVIPLEIKIVGHQPRYQSLGT